MSAFIEFQDVTFGYPNEDGAVSEDVIEHFNLKIEKGSFVAVLGHNGCGKSTVAKLCNAIEVPISGKVLVDGEDTADEEKTLDIRKKVGVVFQNPDNQIVATIVEDDVAGLMRLSKMLECMTFVFLSRTSFRADKSSVLPLQE